MSPNDPRIIEYQNDLNKYRPWGTAFYFDTLNRYINSNIECSTLMLHNGLEFCKNLMKLNAITDVHHSDVEIEKRLCQIDDDIRKAEDVLLHDLSFRGLLMP